MRSLRHLALCFALLGLAACSGRLGLRYGETLCDSQNPCAPGFTCRESVCVPAVGDGGVDPGDSGDEPFEGDWDGPLGDGGLDPDLDGFCRVDAQCASGEACIDAHCRTKPCTGVTCGGSDVCSFSCVPTTQACVGKTCAENLEHCVAGACLPTCIPDPCDGVTCTGGQLCVNGACRSVTPCDDAFCPDGFLCALDCGADDPCDPNPCNPGWSCQVQGDEAKCVANDCSGLVCGPGELCIQGDCVDPCLGVPCAQGGRLCPQANQVCCNNVCCGAGLLCRQGQCLPPAGLCDPPCASDEICISSQCYCNEVPPALCASNECCSSATCDNPCQPNPCASEPVNRICIKDCTQPAGYRCNDGCTGVTCSLPNTVCDADDGACKCGPTEQICGGGQCCVSDQCTSPCQGNPCAGNPQFRHCIVDCTTSTGYTCTDFCSGITCALPNTACDADDGLCKCGASEAICGPTQCCVGGGCDDPCQPDPCGGLQCVRDCGEATGYRCVDNCPAVNTCPSTGGGRNPDCNPLNGQCWCAVANGACGATQCCTGSGCDDPCQPDPCGGLQCVRDCAVAGGYTCVNQCVPTDPCTANAQNPDCNPQTGGCACLNAAGTTYNVCGGSGTSMSCCEADVCATPCAPNPCTTPNTRCTVACAFSGADYSCSDPCSGNTCSTQNGGRNPDCRPNTTNQQNAQCYCNDDPSDAVCASGTCCTAGIGCDDPCAPNPCSIPASKCTVACATAGNDYTCANPCASQPCAQPQPTCAPQADGTRTCSCGGGSCGAPNCCVSDTCVDPCAGDPCGALECRRDCSKATGYVCVDNCAGFTCPAQNPVCDPSDPSPSTRCSCGSSGAVCSGTSCCVSGTCDDACSPNPCGGLQCVRDCAQAVGYRCVDNCSGFTCPAQNPTCDPADPTPSTRCDCNGSATCTGNQCCVNGTSCADPCAGSPCASDPTNKKCVRDCAQTVGYRCESFCTGVNCASPLTCDPADGVCGCGASYASCDPPGTIGSTNICCQSGGNYSCIAPLCVPGSCGLCPNSTPRICDPCTGCVGCSG